MMRLRTYLFYAAWGVATFLWSLWIIIMMLLPFRVRHMLATSWADISVWLLRLICGVKWQVHGRENLPDFPVIVVVNHQSTWETVFTPLLIRRQVWVLKKELVQIPFFGWAMASLGAIAIDRSRRKKAMEQVIEQGKQRMSLGFSVVMFPEGHRFPPDAPLHFKQGAVRLASSLNVPILPIAHNAGQFWPRRGVMHSGTVQVAVGELIYPEGVAINALNQQVENWVREQRDGFVAAENARRQG